MAQGLTLQLNSRTLADIFRHSALVFPEEGCGFLLGSLCDDGFAIDEAVPSANLMAGERDDVFEIDPYHYTVLEDSLRGSGRRILGFFHSHPNHPDTPSFTDLEFARNWPGYLWMIVQVVDGISVSQQTYLLSEDGERFARLGCRLQRLTPTPERASDYERMERFIGGKPLPE